MTCGSANGGNAMVVRYADDTIIGFEHQQDAERFLADLSARLAEFGLGLHPDKTRLILLSHEI
jgi:RNA-directed DNA polymerase